MVDSLTKCNQWSLVKREDATMQQFMERDMCVTTKSHHANNKMSGGKKRREREIQMSFSFSFSPRFLCLMCVCSLSLNASPNQIQCIPVALFSPAALGYHLQHRTHMRINECLGLCVCIVHHDADAARS